MKRSFFCRKIFLIEEDVLVARYWKLLLVCLFVWSCATALVMKRNHRNSRCLSLAMPVCIQWQEGNIYWLCKDTVFEKLKRQSESLDVLCKQLPAYTYFSLSFFPPSIPPLSFPTSAVIRGVSPSLPDTQTLVCLWAFSLCSFSGKYKLLMLGYEALWGGLFSVTLIWILFPKLISDFTRDQEGDLPVEYLVY